MGKEIVFIDCIWIGLLCTISYADWKEKRIPNKLLLGVAVCAAVQMFFWEKKRLCYDLREWEAVSLFFS